LKKKLNKSKGFGKRKKKMSQIVKKIVTVRTFGFGGRHTETWTASNELKIHLGTNGVTMTQGQDSCLIPFAQIMVIHLEEVKTPPPPPPSPTPAPAPVKASIPAKKAK
jgi:hypothetical protein